MSAALPIAALAALAAAGALSRAGSRARRSALPRHLRFLDGLLGARHKGLATYFPETARGTLQPGPGERYHAPEEH